MMSQPRTFLRMIGQPPGEAGRARKFDPAYGQVIRDLAQAGDFPEAWAAEIGVTLGTLRNWITEYPEFRADMEIAFLLLTTHWTRRISKAAESPTAKPGLYALIARRFPAIYGTAPVDLEKWLTGSQAIPTAPDAAAGSAASGDALRASPGDIRAMPTSDIEKKLAALRARRAAEEGKG